MNSLLLFIIYFPTTGVCAKIGRFIIGYWDVIFHPKVVHNNLIIAIKYIIMYISKFTSMFIKFAPRFSERNSVKWQHEVQCCGMIGLSLWTVMKVGLLCVYNVYLISIFKIYLTSTKIYRNQWSGKINSEILFFFRLRKHSNKFGSVM